MGFEDDYNPSGTKTQVTRNGVRGIDRISITEDGATTHGYALRRRPRQLPREGWHE